MDTSPANSIGDNDTSSQSAGRDSGARCRAGGEGDGAASSGGGSGSGISFVLKNKRHAARARRRLTDEQVNIYHEWLKSSMP